MKMPDLNSFPEAEREKSEKAIVECLRIAARRGRQIREEQERLAGIEPTPAVEITAYSTKDSDLRYNFIPHEQALAEVLTKHQSGELPLAEMSNRELVLWGEACHRQTENLLWNIEQHKFFLARLDDLYQYLNHAEQDKIADMLSESKWGDSELAQVKSIVENAVWFSQQTQRLAEHGIDAP